eukprot:gene423-biopygen16611
MENKGKRRAKRAENKWGVFKGKQRKTAREARRGKHGGLCPRAGNSSGRKLIPVVLPRLAGPRGHADPDANFGPCRRMSPSCSLTFVDAKNGAPRYATCAEWGVPSKVHAIGDAPLSPGVAFLPFLLSPGCPRGPPGMGITYSCCRTPFRVLVAWVET